MAAAATALGQLPAASGQLPRGMSQLPSHVTSMMMSCCPDALTCGQATGNWVVNCMTHPSLSNCMVIQFVKQLTKSVPAATYVMLFSKFAMLNILVLLV